MPGRAASPRLLRQAGRLLAFWGLSAPTPTVPTMLTVRESMALDLAGRHYKYPAVRETHAYEHLGYTATRYHQVLNALLDRPDAMAEMPQVVARLRRVREARRRVRQ